MDSCLVSHGLEGTEGQHLALWMRHHAQKVNLVFLALPSAQVSGGGLQGAVAGDGAGFPCLPGRRSRGDMVLVPDKVWTSESRTKLLPMEAGHQGATVPTSALAQQGPLSSRLG